MEIWFWIPMGFNAVSDNDKLIQDLLNFLMTPISGNKMFPWYGSDVSGILIGSNYDLEF